MNRGGVSGRGGLVFVKTVLEERNKITHRRFSKEYSIQISIYELCSGYGFLLFFEYI